MGIDDKDVVWLHGEVKTPPFSAARTVRRTAVPHTRHFRKNGGYVGRVTFYQPDALRLS